MGYYRAGFEVVGVDINPQPHYPFKFYQEDALKFPLDGFDAIHASPPCQYWSSITATSGDRKKHPQLIEPTRKRLSESGVPYIIENVPRAPLYNPILICGVERNLRLGPYVLRRHRLFETNWPLWSYGCGCYRGDGITLGVYGGGTSSKERNPNTKGGRPYKGRGDERKRIMGMEWCKTNAEVNQAIPPAYTEFIGKQLIEIL